MLDRYDRFLKSDKNYVYYLIDQVLPPVLKGKNVLFEKEIDALLHKAGARYFAEWAFLLAEVKHSFCDYPFFMISSRFYQKNHWLNADLNCRWDQLFAQFEKYNWGFLPSYDRPLRWTDYTWKKRVKNKFCTMHYYGFYEIDENKTKMKKLSPFKYPFWLKVWKNLRWQWRKVKTERPFAPILGRIKELLRS